MMPGHMTFFDPHQRETVAAAMARIIPTDETPGAAEAGAVDFVDRYLSGIGYIYALPDGSGFESLTGKRADAWMKRVRAAQEKYVAGVADLDTISTSRYETEFVHLTEDQQDDVLREIESGGTGEERQIAYGGPVEPALQKTSAENDLGFFELMVVHTRQGFYSDPIYGGNRDRIGWGVIGFPGPSSLAEVHSGRYSSLEWFADEREHPGAGVGDDR